MYVCIYIYLGHASYMCSTVYKFDYTVLPDKSIWILIVHQYLLIIS